MKTIVRLILVPGSLAAVMEDSVWMVLVSTRAPALQDLLGNTVREI